MLVGQQKQIAMKFPNQVVGQYSADIPEENKMILELKAAQEINPVHKTQVINYLKTTGSKVGYLINFGKSPLDFRRLSIK